MGIPHFCKTMNHFRTSIKVLLLLTIVSSVVFTIRTSITTPTETNTAQNLEDVFSLAKKESLGFFDDVASAHWKLLKKKVSDMSPNYNPRYLPYSKDRKIVLTRFEKQHKVGHFYQNHYEPDFICQHERRIGTLGDGGKWICDPHRISKQDSCLVYSIGSNNDFSFEEAVLKDIGSHCEIHTFDFDDFSEGAEKLGLLSPGRAWNWWSTNIQIPLYKYKGSWAWGSNDWHFQNLRNLQDFWG